MHDSSHEPSSAKAIKPDLGTDPNDEYDISSFSPEQQAWERKLKRYLGDFYYPRYIEAKRAGRETAWDFVKDVPGLPRILVIGDSISRGCTMPLRHVLQNRVNVHRAPQNCSSTAVGVERLDSWLDDGAWDLITFNFGIHDRETPTPDYTMRLTQIASRLISTGARLLWVTSTPVPEGAAEYREGAIDRLNEAATALMKEQNVSIFDLHEAVKPYIDEYQLPENCHFEPEGYEFMGRLMAEKILAELETGIR